MDDARDLLVRLRAAARKRRLGTHELANALGVPRATLRQWLGSTASRPRGAYAKRIRLFLWGRIR